MFIIQDIIPPVKKIIKPAGKIIKKQSRNKYVSMFLAVLLVFETIASVFIPFQLSRKSPYILNQEANAAGESWFNTGGTWTYRRAIGLSPATTVANYQVKVTLTAANFDYTKLSFPATGADLRFTGSDGATSQDYWIESWVNGGTSVIWVEVATSGESTIYMYYGNSAATSASNISNTFLYGIDWTQQSSLPANWVAVSTTTAFDSTNGITMTIGGGWTKGIYLNQSFSSPISYMSFGITTATAYGLALSITTAPTGSNVIGGNGDKFATYGGTGGAWSIEPVVNGAAQAGTGSGTNFTLNTLYNVEAQYLSGNSQRWVIDGTTHVSRTDATQSTVYISYTAFNNPSTTKIKQTAVRKYAATEPSTSLGAEEYFSYLTVTGTGTMNAGASQVITITAKTNLGNTYTGYTGDKSLTFSGPNVSGGGNSPTCSDKTSADVNFGTGTTITFASGAGACTMKLYKVESASIDVTDGTINSTTSAAYDLDVTVSGILSGASIQINSNDAYTTSVSTILSLSATNASQMKFSNNNIAYSAYEAYGASKAWDITNAAYGGTPGDGAKTVYVIYKDVFGNEAAAVNDNIVYDTTSPTNPTAAVDAQGAVTDTWQNNKNDPNFTSFTGESDTNGVSGFYVYFGTDAVGVTLDWIATDAFDPASFLISNVRYLRVIAKDNAGLYADPDGAGAACTNTNTDRPADADCWATIFIHKYDIDNPNTPSPVSSPASWTNANSFDFSWSDPGDVGGSGVKDYTYQTNAGTGATTTAGISVTGLTSNANGTKLFSVKANDNAGNSGTNGSSNFYYDNTAPTNAGAATDGNGSLDDAWGIVSDPNFTWVAGTDAGDQSGIKEYDVYWGASASGTTVTATVATNTYNPAAIPVNTPYYLRIRTRDNALNESGWNTIFTMKYSQAASAPSALSQAANSASLAFGDWTNDTTPTLNFTLTDPDSDTLGYIIKIDNNSDFSSPEVFYTYSANDLASGAEYSFIVGQAAGTGTYTNGSQGQTLAEGQYYWKIKALESHGLASSEITANSGAMAFGIDTGNPTGTVLGFGAIDMTSIEVIVSGASDAVSGLNASTYYFENTAAATNSGWQAGTSWVSTTLSPNTQYAFKATSKDKAGNTETTAAQNKYTLANAPAAPTVNNAAPTSLGLNVNPNSNPASTEFAIYKEQGATCDGAGGSYIAANGSDNGATAVWQTDVQWGAATATGLSENIQYSFCVKARNGDNTETGFSPSASGTTTISNLAPNAPVLISPADASSTSDTTPTLSANYSDPNSGDVGTTNYRIATSAGNCLSGTVIDSGSSSATSIDNEDTVWTPGSSIGSDGIYYWCARNNDGALTSSWTSMGNFILDTSAPTGTTLGFGTIAAGSIAVTVSGAADSGSGLHSAPYYFENTASGANSGWTSSLSWTSSDLACGTTYSFRVKARDALSNESLFTNLSSVATQGCGGGSLPSAYNPPSNPPSTPENPSSSFQIIINNGDQTTSVRKVALKLVAGADTARMAISNNADFTDASQESYQSSKTWNLSSGDGVKTVYVRFYTSYGVSAEMVSASIVLDTVAPAINASIKNFYHSTENIVISGFTEPDAKINARLDNSTNGLAPINADSLGSFSFDLGRLLVGSHILDLQGEDLAGNVGESLSLNFVVGKSASGNTSSLQPEITVTPPQGSITLSPTLTAVPESTPSIVLTPTPNINPEPSPFPAPESLSSGWNLLPAPKMEKFSSLPQTRDISFYVQKFPNLADTFKKLGISQLEDLSNTPAISFDLPSLSKIINLQLPEIAINKVNSSRSIPLAEIPVKVKKDLPAEIVFVKTADEKIDFGSSLVLDDKKDPQQKISLISGKSLNLIVKPDKPVKNIRGYIVFKSASKKAEIKAGKLDRILSFFGLVQRVSAQDIEQKLVLAKFEYLDSDNDGIWTASIESPKMEGEYEILTVLDYEDLTFGSKIIKLITVIDPEGYVYRKTGNDETRISNAVISIFWLNSQTEKYELWPAKDFNQQNPQTTGSTGHYSFLVPEGSYYLRVESPDYLVYQGQPFEMINGQGVHANIELQARSNWKTELDWKTILLIIFGFALVYNFYRDWRRRG